MLKCLLSSAFRITDLDIRVDATFKGEEQLFLCSFICVFKYHLPRFGTVFFLC